VAFLRPRFSPGVPVSWNDESERQKGVKHIHSSSARCTVQPPCGQRMGRSTYIAGRLTAPPSRVRNDVAPGSRLPLFNGLHCV
jgi:hypothetical protein